MLGFTDDGEHLRMRESCAAAEIAGDRLFARWRPYPDVTVETFVVPAGDWHLRVHEVTTPRRLDVVEGGFAIAKPDFRAWTEITDARRAEVATQTDISVILGYDGREPVVISPLSNTNVMTARTLVPQLRGTLEPGTHVLCCAVLARPLMDGAELPPPPECPDIAALRSAFAGKGRTVPVFADGRDRKS